MPWYYYALVLLGSCIVPWYYYALVSLCPGIIMPWYYYAPVLLCPGIINPYLMSRLRDPGGLVFGSAFEDDKRRIMKMF
jgi:hypothetical protein